MPKASSSKESYRTSRLLWVIVGLIIVAALGAGALVWMTRKGSRDERLYNMGVWNIQHGRQGDAVRLLNQAVRLNPSNMGARMALAQAHVAGKDFDAAFETLDEAEKAGAASEEVGLQRIAVLTARAMHRLEAAGTNYSEDTCITAVAEDMDPAIRMAETLLQKDPKHAEALNVLGGLHAQKADILKARGRRVEEERQKAEKLQRAQEAEKRRVESLELMAQVRGELADARRAYERAIEAAPDLPAPRLALAQQYLLLPIPNAADARRVLEPILVKQPSHTGALFLTAAAERFLGNDEEALDLLRRIPSGSPERYNAMINEADLLIEKGRFDEADALTEELIEKGPTQPRAAYLRARVLLQRNDFQGALPLLQSIFIRDSAHWPQARYALADSLLRAGKREQALDAFRAVVKDADALLTAITLDREEHLRIKYEACMVLARELRTSAGGEAARYAQTALLLSPARPEAYQLARETTLAGGSNARLDQVLMPHATALYQAQRFDEAIALCNADRAALADKTVADRLIAACLVGKGSFVEAIRLYESLLAEKTTPNSDRIRLELAGLYFRLGRYDDAEAIFRGMLKTMPNDAQIIRQLASVLLAAGKASEAGDLLLQHDASGSRAVELGLPLLNLYLREKNYDAAIELVKGLIREHPQEPSLRVLVGGLLWDKGDRTGAREYFDQALAADPPPLGGYRRALLDIVEGRYAEAVRLAEDGIARFPMAHALHVFLAVAIQGTGDGVRAESVFERGMANPEWPPILRRSAALMAGINRAGRGDFALPAGALDAQAASAGAPPPVEAAEEETEFLRFLAVVNALPAAARKEAALCFNVMLLMASVNAVAEAHVQAERLEQLLPDQPLPATERARLLDRLGLHTEALAEYDRVLARYPNYVSAWFMKSQSLLEAGDAEAAIAVLNQLLAKPLTEAQRGETIWTLATEHQKLGRNDQAVAYYKEATQYARLAPWAYNNLAWILGALKGDLDGAVPYARMAREKLPQSAPIADTLGWLLVQRNEISEAVTHLEFAARTAAADPTLRYHLAAAYHRAGRASDALREVKEALAIGRPFAELEEARALRERLESAQ